MVFPLVWCEVLFWRLIVPCAVEPTWPNDFSRLVEFVAMVG